MATERELRERADKYDLLVLPDSIDGKSCSNCQFFDDGYCDHPKMRMDVGPHWCCALWARPDAPRARPSSLLTRFRSTLAAMRGTVGR